MQSVMPALGNLCLSMKEARLSKLESKKLPLVKDVYLGGGGLCIFAFLNNFISSLLFPRSFS